MQSLSQHPGSDENSNHTILTEILSHLRREGDDHNFFRLGREAVQNGIPLEDTIAFILDNTDGISPPGMWEEVNKAYNSYNTTNPINFVKSVTPSDEEKLLNNLLLRSPSFDHKIFRNLPKLLQDACNIFSKDRERDILLVGALGVLSACIPNVTGVYRQDNMYPNLFMLVVAPPASGKGVLKYSKDLASRYHHVVRAQSEDELKKYRALMKAWEKNGGPVPEKPKYVVVFIPGDISKARLIQQLDWNNGSGLVFETELDSLANAQKQDWGPTSDLLRKIYHNEPISVARKGNDGEHVEVNCPHPSYVASATPDQVPKLISSPDDGLMSRFSFYTFISNGGWEKMPDNGGRVNLTDYFKTLADRVYEMTLYLEKSPTVIELSDHQSEKMDTIFDSRVKEAMVFAGDNARSLVIRQAVMLFKICMVLTAIRKFESGGKESHMVCSDMDFETACSIVHVFYEHSLLILQTLPKQRRSDGTNNNAIHKKFFNALPTEFKRIEAIILGKRFNIAEITVDRFLLKCIDTLLEKVGYGAYRKISST